MLKKGIINKVFVIFFQGLALLTLPLISKYIGSREYGIWSIIYGMMQMLVPIFILQLDSAFTRFLSGNKSLERISNKFVSIFLLLLLIAIVVSVSFPFFDLNISNFMFASESYVKYVYITVGWVFIRVFINFSRNYFRTFGKFHIDTKISIAQQLTIIFSIAYVAITGKELYDFFIIILSVEALLLLITLILVFRELSFEKIKINIPKKYFIYAIPLVPTMILSWVINYSDQLMIVHFSSLEENARYSLYYTYSRIPHWIIITPLNYALLPFLSKFIYSGENISKVNNYIKESVNISFIIISTFIIGLIFYGSEILYLLSNEEVNSSSINLLMLISFSVFATALYQIVYHILSLKNKTGVLIYIFGLGAVINVLFNYFTIPEYGIIGAAISTLISFIIVGLLTCKASKLTFKEIFYPKTLVFLLFVFLGAYFVKVMFFSNLYLLGVGYVILLIAYLGFIYKFLPSYYLFIINKLKRVIKF